MYSLELRINSIYNIEYFLKHDKRLRIRFYTCTTEAIYLNHRTITIAMRKKNCICVQFTIDPSQNSQIMWLMKKETELYDMSNTTITWEKLSCLQHIWVVENRHDPSLFRTHEIAKVRIIEKEIHVIIIFKNSYSVWILWQITHFIPKSTIIWTFNRMVSKIIE